MALLTGAYPVRLGWTEGVIGYKMGVHDGMSPAALTLAEIFQSEEYATAISGKWHLGDQPGTRPPAQEFANAYYLTHSNNQVKTIWRGDEVVEEMEARIGELLAAVSELSLEKETLVVFISDNGPQKGEQARRTSTAPNSSTGTA